MAKDPTIVGGDAHDTIVLDDAKAPAEFDADGIPVPQPASSDEDPMLHLVQATMGSEQYIEVDALKPAIGMDPALEIVFAKYGMERLGGASGRGWSSRSVLQQCPYRYKMQFLIKPEFLVGRSAPALETGSCFHAFLALGYESLIKGEPAEGELRLRPSVLKTELLAAGASSIAVMEAWRLYSAYVARYSIDYITPLAVELFAKDHDTGDTCRYDLIAKIEHPTGIVPPGVWVVEHKTATRFDDATLDGWFNDGEILGQMKIWNKAKLSKTYGKLIGVCVNLVSKTKEPGFERIFVPFTTLQIKQHESDLRALDLEEKLYHATGIWPRRRAACVGRYGKCPLFDHCADRLAPT